MASNARGYYRLKLLSDVEIASSVESSYGLGLLRTTHASMQRGLDSAIFGASVSEPKCSICKHGIQRCPGHACMIRLPFPIPRSICIADLKSMIGVICPICSHILTDVSKIKLLEPSQRLAKIKNVVASKSKGDTIECMTCHNWVKTIKVRGQEPKLTFGFSSTDAEYINPIQINTILSNFVQPEELGFSHSYHPSNFMTSTIVIVPNKLRPKSITSSESAITSYYKNIVESICPGLEGVYKIMSDDDVTINPRSSYFAEFEKYYFPLIAYYMLITDMGSEATKDLALNMVNKRDRQHVDDHNTLIGRLKGKERKQFSQGVVGTRHDVSARTVLGGDPSSPIHCVSIPKHLAVRMGMLYPVYKQNLDSMRQLVAAMSQPSMKNNFDVPHIVRIVRKASGAIPKITLENAIRYASLLEPGDKLGITLMNTDIAMQYRFPVVREESWSSLEINLDNNSIITIPLSICEMKMADFDGDEAQVCIPSSAYLTPEAILLHSTSAQLVAYKNGEFAIWYAGTSDIPYGIQKIKPSYLCRIRNNEMVEPYSPVTEMEKYLPKDLTYSDSRTEIKNGKFVGDKTNMLNMDLHKYVSSMYGPDVCEDMMNRLIRLAYDLNHDFGGTLGFELRIFGKDTEIKIKEILENTYSRMCEIEQGNDPRKDILQIREAELQKAEIKRLLLESAAGTNLDAQGFTKSRQSEYYQITVAPEHVKVGGTRIQPILAEGTRTCSAFSRNSIDPKAYGYVDQGYGEDLPLSFIFFESKEQRFALFQKGHGTQQQGYVSKRLCMAYGNIYLDYVNCVTDGYKLISQNYACIGLNPRLLVVLEIPDAIIEPDEFKKKYPGDERLHEIHEIIQESNKLHRELTIFTSVPIRQDVFSAGFNYEQFINSHSTKGTTEKKLVEKLIRNIYEETRTSITDRDANAGLIYHEFYFRTKLMQCNCEENVIEQIFKFFVNSLASCGDGVGIKAAIAASEPLTQASLHAIHSVGSGGASGERIMRSMGLARFEELLAGARPRNTVYTFVLYDRSKDAAISFANKHETFFFRDIVSNGKIIRNISRSSRVPASILAFHTEKTISAIKDIVISPNVVSVVWDLSIVSGYDISVTTIINNILSRNPEILFITGNILNSREFMAYIFFRPDQKDIEILSFMAKCQTTDSSMIIHGQSLKNCYVSENKNIPGTYMVEANEAVEDSGTFEQILTSGEVDPRLCKTTNITQNIDIFGVCEAKSRHYDMLTYTAANLSDTSGVLSRHYKVMADATFANGYGRFASCHHLKNDPTLDGFRLLNFEVPRIMLKSLLTRGEAQPINDVVSTSMFGLAGNLGTGSVNITGLVPLETPVKTLREAKMS